MAAERFYAAQSVYTDPGSYASRLDQVPNELGAILEVARQLVFHYRADGDFEQNGIGPSRIGEIDMRYADLMFARIFQLADLPLTDDRQANQQVVGCCRDFTVLFLAIARHKRIPARARVGFATYFAPGWYVDHVIAEVWDSAEQRWRLVEPEIADTHVDHSDGTPIDPLDVPADRFLVGAHAWQSCRGGGTDASRFVVAPDLHIPSTRGWPYVRHNLIHDLAALAKNEMLLWDDWGLIEQVEPPSQEQLDLLDALAVLTSSSYAPLAQLLDFYDRDEFRVPPQVTSCSPAHDATLRVHLRAPA